jgi:hypothetical protein
MLDIMQTMNQAVTAQQLNPGWHQRFLLKFFQGKANHLDIKVLEVF